MTGGITVRVTGAHSFGTDFAVGLVLGLLLVGVILFIDWRRGL